MTSLVPADGSYQPRIMPNVFSDMPSQSNTQLEDAKRSRAGLTLLVILLVGALIFAVAVIFVLRNENGTPNEQIAELQRTLDLRDEQILDLNGQISQYQTAYGAYAGIHTQRAEGVRVRGEIEELVRNRPWLVRPAGNYQQTIWASEEPRVTRALETEATNLRALKARLEGIPRPIGANAADAPGAIGGPRN